MNYEDIVDSLTAYKKYQFIAWGIVLILILIGISLSIYEKNWVILARVGALIVVVSLFLEGTGIIQYFSNKIIKVLKNLIHENILLQEKINPSNLKEEALSLEIEKRQTLVEKVIYDKFKKTEFSIATLGTILWGFADLVNVVYKS